MGRRRMGVLRKALLVVVVAVLATAAPAAVNCPPYPACTTLTPITLPIATGLSLSIPQDCACGWDGTGSPLRTSFVTLNARQCATSRCVLDLADLSFITPAPAAADSCVRPADFDGHWDLRPCPEGFAYATTSSTSSSTTSSTSTSSTSSSSTSSTTVTTSSSSSSSSTSSSSTTSSSTTTSTSSTTLVADGALPLYDVGVDTLSSVTTYAGGSALSPTQSNTETWWVTARAYTRVWGTATVNTPPGAGDTWTLKLIYAETALTATQACGDQTLVETTLGTISGTTAQSVIFAADLTTVNGFVGITAPSCFQVKFEESGSVASTTHFAVSLEVAEAGGDGIAAFSGSDTESSSGTFYMASTGTQSVANIAGFWQAPAAMAACTGALVITNAPGTSNTWAYDIFASTAGKTGTQTCDDLTYAAVTGCTITDTAKRCSFALTAATIPANGCFRARRTVSAGTPGATGAQTWSLECTSDTTETATAGGAVFAGWTGLNNPDTFYGGHSGTTSATGGEGFFRNGDLALTTCAGNYAVATTGSGTGSPKFDIALRYSTSPVATTESCSDAALTQTGVLCTVDVGTELSCDFSAASVAIPSNGCVGLVATKSGTITSAPADGNWTITCQP